MALAVDREGPSGQKNLVDPNLTSNYATHASQSDQADQASLTQSFVANRKVSRPRIDQWTRVIFFQDHNTRVVVIGASLLGFASGLVGSFTLLRRRALLGDALAHATLPGIATAFIFATLQGWHGKSLPILLLGGVISGLAGLGIIFVIKRWTRLKDDVALGVVLSVFFGLGVSMLGLIQQMPSGHSAGLEGFIYGSTASMIASDAWLIGGSALVCIVVAGLLFKEFKLLCFDQNFGATLGYPMHLLDYLLMALVVIVSIVGLQAVGLILMIALLVTPAATARFWTDDMQQLAIFSACLGALGCAIGALTSALFPRLPSGAMIVLVVSSLFAASMLLGVKRGVLIRWVRRRQLNARIDRQHLLRGIFELLESSSNKDVGISWSDLLRHRSWSARRLRSTIEDSIRAGYVKEMSNRTYLLTHAGDLEATRLVREHRLWEIYLISYAETAVDRVDRDADAIEHVLEPSLIAELEYALLTQHPGPTIPPNPHEKIGHKPLPQTERSASEIIAHQKTQQGREGDQRWN